MGVGVFLWVGAGVGMVFQAAGLGDVLVVRVDVVTGEELEDAAGGWGEEEVGEGGAVGGDDEFGFGEELGLLGDGKAGEGVGFDVVLGEKVEEDVFVDESAAPGVAAADVDAAGGFGRGDGEEGTDVVGVGVVEFAEGEGGDGGEGAAAVVAIDAGFEAAIGGDAEGVEGFEMEGAAKGGVDEVEGGGVDVSEAGEGVDEPMEVVFPGAGADQGEDVCVEGGGFGESGVVGDAVAAGGRKDVGGEVGEDVVVGGEDDAVVGEDAAAFDGDGSAGRVAGGAAAGGGGEGPGGAVDVGGGEHFGGQRSVVKGLKLEPRMDTN